MKQLTEAQKTQLETLIDATSVTGILEALEEICMLKCHHIISNWQDRPLANQWKRAAANLSRLAVRVKGFGI